MTARALLGAAVTTLLAAPAMAAEEVSSTFLGLPTWLWKTANLLVFFGLLVYLLAKPMRAFFTARSETIARQLDEARRQREEAARLTAEMQQRVASLEQEIGSLRERMRGDGERERAALIEQGTAEAARLLAQVDQEAGRRVEEARAGLAREAADVAAELAWELLEKELTQADRERIFITTLERLKAGSAGGAR